RSPNMFQGPSTPGTGLKAAVTGPNTVANGMLRGTRWQSFLSTVYVRIPADSNNQGSTFRPAISSSLGGDTLLGGGLAGPEAGHLQPGRWATGECAPVRSI